MFNNKKKIKNFIFLVLFMLFLSGCSQSQIIIGQTNPEGLFDVLLVYPISYLMNYILFFSNNGALAIALTTVILVLITSPLEIFSQVEAKKQQDIQPLLQKLKDKYPDTRTDRKQQQDYAIEMQKIYSQRGLSIFGMCLPIILLMFIQLPILMAMNYAVTRLKVLSDYELNLFGVTYSFGSFDPGIYYIPYIGTYIKVFIITTFVVMLISQYFSLDKDKRSPKTNPMAGQMYLMNLLFIFFFWNQPIALSIYWTISNLLRLFLRLFVVNNIVKKQYDEYNSKKTKKFLNKYTK